MKLNYYKSEKPICYYKTDKQVEIPDEITLKEVRAMWVSNVANIDLPTVENIKDYQDKVITMLDTCVSFNINTIFFQVRTNNDAFYCSNLNPYSRFFTGKEGKKPPFDVFSWVIEEANKRRIDVHAWCNPYRLSMEKVEKIEEYLNTCDDLNFAKRNPDIIVQDNSSKLILNPALDKVKKHIIDSMVEIVKNYKVKGIHFDDYFYPYGDLNPDYDDYIYMDKKYDSVQDFRRKNVNDLLEGVYHAIKKVNKSLQFGVSPFGIWKNKKEGIFGSNTDPACTESYHALYADTLAWIDGGYLDYLVPQIYWEFGHKIAPFADICDFWVEVMKNKSIDLYIGHGAYRLGSDGEFSNKYEIVNQVKYANQFKEVKGNVFFTYKNFIDKEKAYSGMQELKKLLNGENQNENT